MSIRVRVKPTSDIFIRFLLGSESNKDLLLDFINAVLEDAEFPLIRSVTILNPFNLKTTIYDKESILDVKAVDAYGKVFIVEIQSTGNEHFVSRSVNEVLRSVHAPGLGLSPFYPFLRAGPLVTAIDSFKEIGQYVERYSLFGSSTT